MPGAIGVVSIEVGDAVTVGDLLFTIEAMKMETVVIAERSGTIGALLISPGAQVEAQDLVLQYDGEPGS